MAGQRRGRPPPGVGRHRASAGTGWQTYDKIAGGSDGTYTARKLIGGGWQVYGQITGAGDVDHDGRADLLAHDQVTKRVYLHAGTGDWRRPFAKRTLTDEHPGVTYNHIA
ncbi:MULTISPECIES: hypothetical protein [unclassified Streptomyces]|uniref:hypothetical protein n=1 Tax=unclassified Streptomyces TaxID=2593676 RepID=UPI0036F82E43